jgi:hypothetical protein
MKSKMKIGKTKKKKKGISTLINSLNPWHGLLDWKSPIWKNHEVQFLTNQILKDEIEKKNQ